MKTYETLIDELCKKEWGELTINEKNQLINGYILSKPIQIPNRVEYQRIVFNLLNKDEVEKYEKVNMKNLLFQAIKENIEKDLGKAYLNNQGIDSYGDKLSKFPTIDIGKIFREALL